MAQDVEYLELSYNCWQEWKLTNLKQFALSTKIKDTIPSDLAILLLGTYPMEICAHVNKETGKVSLEQFCS